MMGTMLESCDSSRFVYHRSRPSQEHATVVLVDHWLPPSADHRLLPVQVSSNL